MRFISIGKLSINLMLFISLMVLSTSCHNEAQDTTWPVYRGNSESTAYAALDQINKTNVNKLKVAWIYKTGDAREGNRSTIQCNPIIVNGMMYVTSPQLKLIALNPESGKEIWKGDWSSDVCSSDLAAMWKRPRWRWVRCCNTSCLS